MTAAILVALPLIVQGQGNLVPNGSFEDIVSCPTGTAQIHLAVPWLNDVGGVELYHGCNPGSSSGSPHVGVPANTTGHQYAHSGEGYAGIFAYGGPFEPEGREYLQVELTEPIQASVRYKVSFWASPADKYQYAVTSLGAYFSDTLMTRAVFNSVLDVEPSVENPADHPLADKDIWHMVTDTFNSRYGGERYLVIGNFRSAEESNLLWVDSGATQNHNRSYYYIDDISVIALDSIPKSIAEPATELALTLTAWPNPATSLLHIRSGLPLARLRLLDLSGRTVHAQEAHGTTHTIPLHTLPAGLYLLEAEDTTGRKAVQRVVK